MLLGLVPVTRSCPSASIAVFKYSSLVHHHGCSITSHHFTCHGFFWSKHLFQFPLLLSQQRLHSLRPIFRDKFRSSFPPRCRRGRRRRRRRRHPRRRFVIAHSLVEKVLVTALEYTVVQRALRQATRPFLLLLRSLLPCAVLLCVGMGARCAQVAAQQEAARGVKFCVMPLTAGFPFADIQNTTELQILSLPSVLTAVRPYSMCSCTRGNGGRVYILSQTFVCCSFTSQT